MANGGRVYFLEASQANYFRFVKLQNLKNKVLWLFICLAPQSWVFTACMDCSRIRKLNLYENYQIKFLPVDIDGLLISRM